MKRLVALLAALLILVLSGCGKVSNTMEITCDTSQIYSTADIYDAMEVVEKYFWREFDGCTLTALGYAGDEKRAAMESWAAQYGAREAIVLVSSFETGKNTNGALNANDTYRNYQWVLVRGSNGAWEHKTHGYG